MLRERDVVPLCAVVLLTVCWPVKAQLWVDVFNLTDSTELNYLKYTDLTLFSNSYANIGDLRGFLHVPAPRNACSYIEPLPVTNLTWFALVSNYPACPEDMLVNVRAAGYQLIITSAHSTSDKSVPRFVKNSRFPMLIVTPEYSDLLTENVSYPSLDHPELQLEVKASLLLSVFVVVFAFFMCCMCSCLTGCCCCYCRNRRSRLRAEGDFLQYRDRQHNYEQIQRRERMARQELIESILRQLQELQVDLRTQTPLGAAETQRLPTRPYQRGQSKCDTCAICVEEFVEGETLRWLPCDHAFHPQCIDEWLSHHSSLCPLCKAAVPHADSQGAVPVPFTSDSSTSSSPLLSSVSDRRYGSV